MRVFEQIILNWELICVALAVLVNTVAAFYNLIRLCRSGKMTDAETWLALIEAARIYEKEAEILGGDAGEKLEYVLANLHRFTDKLGCYYDRDRLIELIEGDIAFAKAINPAARIEGAAALEDDGKEEA